MTTITTRAGKGSELTVAELDANFTNLNNDKAETSSLATVATSGSYTDLTNTPTIPSTLTDLGISDGTAGQVLQTDGAGTFSFATASGGGGIALTDLSVGAEGAASGDGAIAYNNTTGVFTYTPPDLSSYLTSVTSSNITSSGVTDGYVLTADGAGNVAWEAQSGGGGGGSPGGSDTQIQYNSSGTFAGSAAMTFDGTDVTLGNLVINSTSSSPKMAITSGNDAWYSGSSGNLNGIKIGTTGSLTDNYDVAQIARNGYVRVQKNLTADGGHTNVRRAGVTVENIITDTSGSLDTNNGLRNIGLFAQATYVGGGNEWNNTPFQFIGSNGVAHVPAGQGTVNIGVAQFGLVVNHSGSKFNHAVGMLSVPASIVSSNGNAYGFVSSNPTLAGSGGNTGDYYAFYLPAHAGSGGDEFASRGFPGTNSYTQGSRYCVYNNNTKASNRLGAIKEAHELWTSTTHSGTTLSLDVGTNTTHEVTLSADITELTLASYSTESSRLTPVTIIFKQDATGGRTVTWPTGTKFAGGENTINTDANAVTFVSALIYGGVYYVTVANYE